MSKAETRPITLQEGTVKGALDRMSQHREDLVRVLGVGDPVQESPLVEDLRLDFQKLREAVAGVVPVLSLTEEIPLIDRSADGTIHWYDPQEGKVYRRNTKVERASLGQFKFASDGQIGQEIPFHEWIKHPGISARVIEAAVYPIPQSLRERIGMPPRIPVHFWDRG